MDLEFIKSVVLGPLVRLIVNAIAGYLVALGISTGSATEVITGVVGALLTLVWSLFQRKSDVQKTPLPEAGKGSASQ